VWHAVKALFVARLFFAAAERTAPEDRLYEGNAMRLTFVDHAKRAMPPVCYSYSNLRPRQSH